MKTQTTQYQRQVLRETSYQGDNTIWEADSPLWNEKPPKEVLVKKVNCYDQAIRFVKITTITEEVEN